MKDKTKKFLMNPWTVTIGGGLVLSVLSVIYDLIKQERVFSTISIIFTHVRNIVVMILNLNIKVWWLLLGIVVLIFVFWLYIKYLEHTSPKHNEPPFLEYIQDVILGYKWRWTWKKDFYGKYYVDELHPICSRCETPLVENFHGHGAIYKCLRCQEGYNKRLPELDNVKMLISDNVRRKYFTRDV